jgi:hypothetical protein
MELMEMVNVFNVRQHNFGKMEIVMILQLNNKVITFLQHTYALGNFLV